MYSKGFRITENTGNNSFSYDIRKIKNPEPQIYVTNLIQGTIDDIQIGDKIVFEEIDSKGEIQSFVGLKNFVKLKHCHSDPAVLGGEESRINGINQNLDVSLCSTGQEIPIYIFDNHNHALFFRYQELFNGNISKGIELIHLDQHTDMKQNSNVIASEVKQSCDLDKIFYFTNYQCNVGNFIQPATQDGLISKVIQINTEYKLLNSEFGILNSEFGILNSEFILDIDLDFWHPQMGIEHYNKTIEITKNLISQASLVTIATSPYFLDQTLAIKILKDIFD